MNDKLTITVRSGEAEALLLEAYMEAIERESNRFPVPALPCRCIANECQGTCWPARTRALLGITHHG